MFRDPQDPADLRYLSTIVGEIFGGEDQRVLAGNALELDERKYVTEADLALLRDAGYTTSAVPEPSTYGLLAGMGIFMPALLRRARRTATRESSL